MEQFKKAPTRKKFLLWSATILSSFTLLKFLPSKKKKKETVKMLGRDGKLVEIDKKLLALSGRKISNEELQKWIKNKSLHKRKTN